MSGVGGDMSRTVSCPICGAEIFNTRRPQHMASDDCQSDENDAQSDLSGWRADE